MLIVCPLSIQHVYSQPAAKSNINFTDQNRTNKGSVRRWWCNRRVATNLRLLLHLQLHIISDNRRDCRHWVAGITPTIRPPWLRRNDPTDREASLALVRVSLERAKSMKRNESYCFWAHRFLFFFQTWNKKQKSRFTPNCRESTLVSRWRLCGMNSMNWAPKWLSPKLGG